MPTDIERGRPRREAARRNNYTEESSTQDDNESEGGTIDSTNGTDVQESESESDYVATPQKNAGRKGGKGGGLGGRGGRGENSTNAGGNNHAGRGTSDGRGRGGGRGGSKAKAKGKGNGDFVCDWGHQLNACNRSDELISTLELCGVCKTVNVHHLCMVEWETKNDKESHSMGKFCPNCHEYAKDFVKKKRKGRKRKGTQGTGGRGTNSGRGSNSGRGRDPDLPRGVLRITEQDGSVMLTEDTRAHIEDEEEDNVEDDEEDNVEEDEEVAEEKHWRGMKYDPDIGEFVLDPSNNDADIPRVTDYMMVRPTDSAEVRVVFNAARQVMLEQLMIEYENLFAKLKSLRVACSSQGLLEHLFGEKSKLMTVMMRRLKLTYEEVSQFLSTFYFACEFGRSAKQLEEHEKVNYEGYMDTKTYNSIWNKISVCGKDGLSPYIWRDLQDALNDDCRELFILNTGHEEIDFRISWDDDKIRFHYGTAQFRKDKDFLVGMKPHQHVQSNTRGVVLDSAVSAASGFLLGVGAIRQEHSSNTDNYKEMLKFTWAHRFNVAASMKTALEGIHFCSDRGYWNPPLILSILEFGGTVFGTFKRAPWVPLTYDQKMGKDDERVKIDTKRGRSVFQAFARWNNKMLKILAFRSGSGACSLAGTSHHCDPNTPQVWEFCFPSSAHIREYKSEMSQSDRGLKAFHPIPSCKVSSEDETLTNSYLCNLMNEKVTMLTYSDLDHMWFTLRKFSLTSSSTCEALKRAAPYLSSDETIRAEFEEVLGYAGLKQFDRWK